MKKLFLIFLIPLLVSCSVFHFAKTPEPTIEVKEIRYGEHAKKSRIVVELSEECKKDSTSGCGYSLSHNKELGIFTLSVKGVSYEISAPKGTYGKELDAVSITPVSNGVEITGRISEKGEDVENPYEKPNLIILDILRKTDAEMSEEKNLEKEYSEEENNQKIDLLALRHGTHPDRTRVVFDISDACAWEEQVYPDSLTLKIKGADSKISENSFNIGHEVGKVFVSSINGETNIKVNKASTGGDVQVQLLENPYRLVIDVFKLQDGQTQEQQYADYLAGKTTVSDNVEDLNEYDELLSQKDMQKPDDEITDADRKAVKGVSVLTKQQKAGKRIIVIDPGHGGAFAGTSFTIRKFIRYDYQIQYKKKKNGQYIRKWKTIKGKRQLVKVPLTKTIKTKKGKKTVPITTKVPIYKNIRTIREQDITLAQAKAIKAYFDKQPNSPFKVILTRTTDKKLGKTHGEDYAYRAEVARKNGADAFISVHVNSKGSNPNLECGKAKGFEIMYRSTGNGDKGRLDDLRGNTSSEKAEDKKLQENAKKQGKILAGIVSDQMIKKGLSQFQVPYVDKAGGNHQSIAVLRMSRYPAILIETGYLCNQKDRTALEQPATSNKIAEAVYKGMMEYGKKEGWFK